MSPCCRRRGRRRDGSVLGPAPVRPREPGRSPVRVAPADEATPGSSAGRAAVVWAPAEPGQPPPRRCLRRRHHPAIRRLRTDRDEQCAHDPEVHACESSASTRLPRPRGCARHRRPDRGGRRGGAVQPAQARQAPGPVLGLGAARAVRRAGACDQAGLRPADLDAVAYSFDPALACPAEDLAWTIRGTGCARRTPAGAGVPRHRPARAGSGPGPLRAAPRRARRLGRPGRPGRRSDCACWSCDGRGEAGSHLAGRYARRRRWRCWPPRRCRTRSACSTRTLTEHLGFLRSSDEYKVMALASYGKPRLPRRAAGGGQRHRGRRLPHRPDRPGARWPRAAPGRRS